MLGADLVGFHVQAHGTNFMDTVDRTLESRIDWEHFAVNRAGHRTVVKPFPISVEFPKTPVGLDDGDSPYLDRVAVLRELGVEALFLGIGVDRVHYSKGIIEFCLAIDRRLKKRRFYQGTFSFC